MSPRRPHPYQTSDSRFEVRQHPAYDAWFVIERWWFINRSREEEDGEAEHGPFWTREEAEDEKERLSC